MVKIWFVTVCLNVNAGPPYFLSQLAIMHVNLSVSKILQCLQPYKSPKWLPSGKEPSNCLSISPFPYFPFFYSFFPWRAEHNQASLVLVNCDEPPPIKGISHVPLHFFLPIVEWGIHGISHHKRGCGFISMSTSHPCILCEKPPMIN